MMVSWKVLKSIEAFAVCCDMDPVYSCVLPCGAYTAAPEKYWKVLKTSLMVEIWNSKRSGRLLDCGLWVWVFFFLFGRVDRVVFSSVVRQRLPKPIPNGTKIEHKWDQSGSGGREGATENQQKYNKVKTNANVKNQNKKNYVFEMWGDLLKNRRAQRLGVYQGFFNKCNKNDI